MATPEPTLDRGPSPFALCTSCQVGFEVPDDVWAKGYREVRCGSCNVKFDLHEGIEAARALLAGETLSDDTGLRLPDELPGELPGETTRPEPADVSAEARQQEREGFERYLYDDLEMEQAVTDFDLFSEEAGLPEVAYFERFDAGSFAEADEAAAALLEDPTVSPAEALVAAEGAAAHDDGSMPRVIDDVPPEQPLVFDYEQQREVGLPAIDRDDTDADASSPDAPGSGSQPVGAGDSAGRGKVTDAAREKASRGLVPGMLRGALFIAIALAAFGGWMVTMHQNPAFYNNGFWRPAVLASCRVFACTVPSRVDLDQLVLIQRNVYSHPGLADALVVNVSFRNEAAFDQRYPVLVVRFSNTLGRPVARRDFKPQDYLDDWQAGDVLEAGRRLDINLEIDDPGKAADSFELNFRAS